MKPIITKLALHVEDGAPLVPAHGEDPFNEGTSPGWFVCYQDNDGVSKAVSWFEDKANADAVAALPEAVALTDYIAAHASSQDVAHVDFRVAVGHLAAAFILKAGGLKA